MKLRVNEMFASFQGEGTRTGLPTVFLRLSGCNLDCKWCDTEYSKGPGSGSEMEIDEVFDEIASYKIKFICITGGEPLLQESLKDLLKILLERGFKIDIETNGSIHIGQYAKISSDIRFSMDVKLLSSGELGSFDLGNLLLLSSKDQLKFVISDVHDMDHAVAFITKHHPICDLIFTPVDNKGGDEIAEWIMNWIRGLEDEERNALISKIRLMVQTHKVIWGSDSRGV